MVHLFRRQVGALELSLETGRLAGQADGSVYVRYGDTAILATATAARKPRSGVDFLPLTIDFEERLYAAGKIPGSFFRREGRPSSEAILADRLTDRPLRPLFPKTWRCETQIVLITLSADQENPLDILGIVGASAALSISDIPFSGPLGACRIGYIDGELVINPTFSQLDQSELDLVVVGTRDAVMMVEAGAKIVDESLLLEAIHLGQEVNGLLVEMQEEMIAVCGVPKRPIPAADEATEVYEGVRSVLNGRLSTLIAAGLAKGDRSEAVRELEAEVVESLQEQFTPEQIAASFESHMKVEVRRSILEEGRRPDGRGLKEVRPITCEVGLIPRTHGSGLFTRGETQVLTLTTLASLGAVQKLDTLSPEGSKRFFHHYNFLPFSTGEARRLGGPGRREIGHGALAERALRPIIPSEEEFPYTIRLVSEVLSSNGSTSMGSVCGSTLSLMDAGVPVRAPVAGLAMGLITGKDGAYAILTDIQGTEDFLGDMDFKVAGTAEGVTALQMDIKVSGISGEIMRQALEQAKEARLFILEKMLETIGETRPTLSPYAPRMTRLQINPDRIGALIGPGGKTIRALSEEFKVTIDVENDGTVFVGSTDGEAAEKAIEAIQRLTKNVEVGEVYTGRVSKVTGFGAFVEILPGRDGMVHISELADYRVPSVEDICSVGDEMTVLVTDIDAAGKIRLSRRALLEGADRTGQGAPPQGPAPRRPDGPGARGGYSGNRGPDRRPPGGDGDRGPRRHHRSRPDSPR